MSALAIVTYASLGAPGVGGTFFVVLTDGARDFQHRVSFSWHHGAQKGAARAAAHRLAARVNAARVGIEHAAGSKHWFEALAYQHESDGSVRQVRTWEHEVARAAA